MQTALPTSSVISKANTFVLSLNERIHTGWQRRGYPFLRRLLKFQLVRWSNTFFKREKNQTKIPPFKTPGSSQYECLTLLLWVRCRCSYRGKNYKYLLSSLSLPLCAWMICVFPSPASSLPLHTSYILCSCTAVCSLQVMD